MTGADDTGIVGLADRLWQAEVDRAPIVRSLRSGPT